MKYSVISFLLTIGTCIIMLLKAMGSVLDFWAVLKMCTAPFTGKASGGTNKSCSLSQYSPCQGGTWWDHHVYWHFPHLRPQCDHSIWGLTVCSGDTAWPLSVWLGELLMTFKNSTGASQVALVVKNCLPLQETSRCWFDPWVRKIPWRRAWQPTPLFLPGESHGQNSLVGYGS